METYEMTNIEESGQGLPDPSKEVDTAEQEMNLVQKTMQNAREQFNAIQLSAPLQIEEEVNKAAAQIKKSQQFISKNVEILQQDSSSTQRKDLNAYDKIKTTTEKSSSGILSEMKDTETSIKAAMDAANAATMNIENSETSTINAMMEAESAISDQATGTTSFGQPQVAVQTPIQSQQPGHAKPVKSPQTEIPLFSMSGTETANAATLDMEKNEQAIMKAMREAESATADQLSETAPAMQAQVPDLSPIALQQPGHAQLVKGPESGGSSSLMSGMEAANTAIRDIENSEQSIMKAMMEAESALADQTAMAASPSQPQQPGMPSMPAYQPTGTQTDGISPEDKAQMEVDNQMREIK